MLNSQQNTTSSNFTKIILAGNCGTDRPEHLHGSQLAFSIGQCVWYLIRDLGLDSNTNDGYCMNQLSRVLLGSWAVLVNHSWAKGSPASEAFSKCALALASSSIGWSIFVSFTPTAFVSSHFPPTKIQKNQMILHQFILHHYQTSE